MRIDTVRTAAVFASAFLALSLQIQVAKAQQVPAGPKDALTIYSAGLSKLLDNPKDQGLLNALRLIDERIAELPTELNQPQMPAPAIQLALELLTGPMSLRAGVREGADPAAGPPVYAQVNFLTADHAKAQALAGRFSGMMAGMMPPSKPAPNLPGVQMVDANGTPVYHGAIKAGDRSAFTLALNSISTEAVSPPRSLLPQGVEPVMSVTFDAEQVQPLLEMAFQHAPPGEVEPVKRQFEMMGIYGADALKIEAAMGYDKDRTIGVARYINYRQMLEKLGGVPSSMLSAADLKRIPADATYASVGRGNLSAIGKMLASMAPPEVEGDPMAMIEQHTGVHPQRDIFDHLGHVAGFYMADTTGGGFLSSILFAEVTNAESLNATLARINGTINQIAQQHAKGYVRIAEKTYDGQTLTVLTFPGIPVPLELCWTVADGYFYAAASPQALHAAVSQGKSGKTSLADNPRFKEMTGGKIDGAMQVQFFDTPRFIRDGYGFVSLGMAALSNMVRSPTDPARDAGIIMPSYSELEEGAKAGVIVSRLEGNDLIMVSQSDRSVLVNVCGTVGIVGGSTGGIGTVALMTGLLLPALSKARQNAKALKSSTQLRQISTAMMTYAAEHDDQLPPNEKALEAYIDARVFDSPHGPVWDDSGDYWLDFSAKKWSDVKFPDQRILGYDRAMFAQGPVVAVLFYDGHVDQMTTEEFEVLAKQQPNAGTDFDLPWSDD